MNFEGKGGKNGIESVFLCVLDQIFVFLDTWHMPKGHTNNLTLKLGTHCYLTEYHILGYPKTFLPG